MIFTKGVSTKKCPQAGQKFHFLWKLLLTFLVQPIYEKVPFFLGKPLRAKIFFKM